MGIKPLFFKDKWVSLPLFLRWSTKENFVLWPVWAATGFACTMSVICALWSLQKPMLWINRSTPHPLTYEKSFPEFEKRQRFLFYDAPGLPSSRRIIPELHKLQTEMKQAQLSAHTEH